MAGHKGKKVPVKFYSPRAWAMQRRQQEAQGRFRETCKECGFKVRGPGHEEGPHHAKRHPKLRSK